MFQLETEYMKCLDVHIQNQSIVNHNQLLYIYFGKLNLNLQLNSLHLSADCCHHLNLPSLFPVPTILITNEKGFLCNLFLLWE